MFGSLPQVPRPVCLSLFPIATATWAFPLRFLSPFLAGPLAAWHSLWSTSWHFLQGFVLGSRPGFGQFQFECLHLLVLLLHLAFQCLHLLALQCLPLLVIFLHVLLLFPQCLHRLVLLLQLGTKTLF